MDFSETENSQEYTPPMGDEDIVQETYGIASSSSTSPLAQQEVSSTPRRNTLQPCDSGVVIDTQEQRNDDQPMQEDASLKQVDYNKETCTILAIPWNTLKGFDVNKKRISLLAIINAIKLSLVKPISYYASREYKKVKYFTI